MTLGRYTSLLCMMVEQQQQQNSVDAAQAGRVAAAAMHAVSAATGRRLASDPGALQMLSVLMHKAANLASQQPRCRVLQMPFCCAAASSGRPVLAHISSSGQREDGQRYINSTLNIALEGAQSRMLPALHTFPTCCAARCCAC